MCLSLDPNHTGTDPLVWGGRGEGGWRGGKTVNRLLSFSKKVPKNTEDSRSDLCMARSDCSQSETVVFVADLNTAMS